jgi:hypothetical protein
MPLRTGEASAHQRGNMAQSHQPQSHKLFFKQASAAQRVDTRRYLTFQNARHIIQIPFITIQRNLKMNQLTELLMYRALHFKQSGRNDIIVDHMLATDSEAINKLQIRNVCAKVSNELADRLDNMCGLLDISKRRFVEAAIINALDEADRVVSEVNMTEAFETEEGK